jgi:hypothetical protein
MSIWNIRCAADTYPWTKYASESEDASIAGIALSSNFTVTSRLSAFIVTTPSRTGKARWVTNQRPSAGTITRMTTEIKSSLATDLPGDGRVRLAATEQPQSFDRANYILPVSHFQ